MDFFLIYEATGNYYKDIGGKFMMRTFVAIDISDKKIIQNISMTQNEFNIKAKPVEALNLHFTLQFLGEVSDTEVRKIIDVLSSIEFSKFKINFYGIGAFPKAKFPRIIWIGTDKDGGELLSNLASKVNDALFSLGYKIDKPFKPHITIFRIKNKVGDITKELDKFRTRGFGSIEVNEIKLKKSDLTPTGPVYTDLKVIKAR